MPAAGPGGGGQLRAEPPGGPAPARRARPGRGVGAIGLVRLGALVAAALLAVTSTGDALVVAAALGIGAGRVLPGLVAAAAAVAATARWGSPDLADLAGAQAVLGPAGLVGPTLAAASSWAAALAVVLAWPGPSDPVPVGRWAGAAEPASLVGAVAVGAFAAGLVWGPGLGGAWPGRVVATVLGAVGALAVAALRARRGWPAAVTTLAAAGLGLGAVATAVAARPEGPDLPGPAGRPWLALVVALVAVLVALGGVRLAATARSGGVHPVVAPGGLRGGAADRRPARPRGADPAVAGSRMPVGWRRALTHPSIPLAVLAVALGTADVLDPAVATPSPVTGGPGPAGALLAVAAVAGVVGGRRWALVAAAPGVAATAHALLAAPATAPGAALALGTTTWVVVVALLVADEGPFEVDGGWVGVAPTPGGSAARWVGSSPAGSRVGAGWLVAARWSVGAAVAGAVVLAPGGWTGLGVAGLDAWSRGAAMALAAASATGVLGALAVVRSRGGRRRLPRYAPAVPGGSRTVPSRAGGRPGGCPSP